MEEVFKHLLHREAKITEVMEAIIFEAMEVDIEAVVLVSHSCCRYLASVGVEFLGF